MDNNTKIKALWVLILIMRVITIIVSIPISIERLIVEIVFIGAIIVILILLRRIDNYRKTVEKTMDIIREYDALSKKLYSNQLWILKKLEDYS